MQTIEEELEKTLQLCNKCGLCLAGCPTYKATGIEWTSARGRVALIRSALLDNKIDLADLNDPIFNCLTCNGCTEHCPPAVPTGEIIFKARQELLRRKGKSWIERFLFQKLLPNPEMLHKAARVLRLDRKSVV